MIEAYFHTMLLLQAAIPPDADSGKTFVAEGRSGDQWLLAPGPVDLGEGTSLVLPTQRAQSIGIGVVDAREFERETYGSAVVHVTVTAVVGIEDNTSWFKGKSVSALIGSIVGGAYATDPVSRPGEPVTLQQMQADCDITPMGTSPGPHYGLEGASIRTLSLRLLRERDGEAFIADAANDLYVFWRSFVFEFA